MMRNVLLAILLASVSGISYAVCNTTITPTAPNSRYQLLNNATEVKDLKTNLIWQRCSLGQTWSGTSCTGTATQYTWADALKTAQSIGGSWRLPNIKELQSLVERACSAPAINEAIFSNTSSDAYWSSSMYPHDSDFVFIVNFKFGGDGNFYFKSGNYYVRLIRDSQ